MSKKLSDTADAVIVKLENDLREAVRVCIDSIPEDEAYDSCVHMVNALEKAHIFVITINILSVLSIFRRAMKEDSFAEMIDEAETFIQACKNDFSGNLDEFLSPFLAEMRNEEVTEEDGRLRLHAREVLRQANENLSANNSSRIKD